jgi:ABC-type phosphate transport system substrate-binding protein
MSSIPERFRRGLLVLALSLIGAEPTRAQQGEPFVVIVHAGSSVDALTLDELSKIFLKREVRWEDGRPIVPVDLSQSATLRERFDEAVHGRPSRAIAAHWQQQVFSGRDVPPAQKSTDAEVAAFVASTPGAVGYVSEGTALPAGVRVVRLGS